MLGATSHRITVDQIERYRKNIVGFTVRNRRANRPGSEEPCGDSPGALLP